jgi:Double zinc ribbon
MTLALFGITNDTLNLVVNLLILFLVVLWLALVAWTYFDARRRIADPVLVACATAASLFPFVGSIVYSILRPPEFLADKKERELEMRASELRVRQLEEASCPNCEHPVERTFLRCPNCRARIKDPCESCGKPIDPRWSICPYCETPQRRAAPPEGRSTQKKRRSSKQPPREPAEAPRRQSAEATRAPTRTSSGSRSSSRPARTSSSKDSEPQRKPAPSRSSRPARSSAESRPSSAEGRPSGSAPPPPKSAE